MPEPWNIDDLLASDARTTHYPATPVFAVPAATPTRVSGRSLRRVAVLAAATVVALAASLLLSSQARTTVADFLGLAVEGERIVLAPTTVPGITPTPFPTPVPLQAIATKRTLTDAATLAGFEPALCGGEPLAVYTLDYLSTTAVVLHYERFDCWQFELAGGSGFLKQAFDGTVVENVLVNGVQAYWIQGGPRLVTYLNESGAEVAGSTRVATRDTLLWTVDGRYYRIEGDLTLAEARAIAASVR